MKTEQRTRKNVPLCAGASAHVDLYNGEGILTFTDLKDDLMGVEISHILNRNKATGNSFSCGNNMRLNLHETFVKNNDSTIDADYIYTDCMGDTYKFKEYFIYKNESGEKIRIANKQDVVVMEDGKFNYTNNGITYPVERIISTYDGMKASTKVDSVSNLELFKENKKELDELRSNSEKLKKDIDQYVIYNKSSEAITYTSDTDIDTVYNKISTGLTDDECVVKREDSYWLSDNVFGARNRSRVLSQSSTNKNNVVALYNAYKALQYSIKTRILTEPINYVLTDAGCMGFNEYGDLIVIYNKSGEYIAIEYEIYYDGDEMKHRIGKVYNEKERTISFKYSHNNQLCEIIDSNGKTLKYEYSTSNMKVYYPGGEELQLIYADDSITVTDSNYNKAIVKLSNNKVSEVACSSIIDKVKYNGAILGEDKEITKITFAYATNGTVITDDENIKYIYVFDSNTERQTNYYVEKKGLVVQAERYVFEESNGRCDKTYEAKRDTLYKTPYSTFVFVDEDYTESRYDEFNVLLSDTTVVNGKDDITTSTATYTYNADEKLCKVETVKRIDNSKTHFLEEKTYVEQTEYNDKGLVSRKQSYVVGEEKTYGISITEYVYDEKGLNVQTISYNSLDPTSKFYDERGYDEKGRIIWVLDSTGRYKTQYEYQDGTTTVRSEKYPNGSKTAYGHSDIDGNSAITVSTKDGEENSIQVLRTNGLATKVKNDDVEYTYEYDHEGRVRSVTLKGVGTVAEMEYTDENDIETILTFEKGEMKVVSDNKDANTKLISRSVGGEATKGLRYVYNEEDKLEMIVETSNGVEFKKYYNYDDVDRVESSIHEKNGAIIGEETFKYDDYGKVSKNMIATMMGNVTYNYTYSADSKKRLTEVEMEEDNIIIKPKYDIIGRKIGKSVSAANRRVLDNKITYLKYVDHATNIPASIRFSYKEAISYKYDRMGNICAIYENGILSTEYEYDKLGRLVRENNKPLNKTTVYQYDVMGNILCKQEYKFTQKSKEELLTMECVTNDYDYGVIYNLVSCGGYSFDYSPYSGQPSNYKGNAVTWRGKDMVSYGLSEFTYDASGRRASKNNITYTYDLKDRLAYQSNGVNYIYDYEELIGFKYKGISYFYRKDILGNIIAIVDNMGIVVVKYVYDAWGNHKVLNASGAEVLYDDFVGNINPYRYRGYYYDTETGLYYLKTRYYDPEICRFISMDDVAYIDPETIGGTNLFAYCNNNPVMNVDPSGNFLISTALIIGAIVGATVGAAVGFGTVAYTDYQDDGQLFNESVKWYEYVGGTVTGAVLGAGIGGIIGVGGTVLTSAVSSVTNKFISDLFAYTLTGTPLGTWEDYAVAFISGGLVKGTGMKGIAKITYDVSGRPLISQAVKIGTNRQDSINGKKYAYDVVTRGLTTFAPSPWKAFYRGGFRSAWDLYKRRYFA